MLAVNLGDLFISLLVFLTTTTTTTTVWAFAGQRQRCYSPFITKQQLQHGEFHTFVASRSSLPCRRKSESYGCSSHHCNRASNILQMAQSHGSSGPPQYEKIPATVVFNKEVGRGSHLIRVQAQQRQEQDVLDYQPGHVLALEIPNPSKASSSENDNNNDNKVQENVKGDEWMRGPYTVTRATESSFDVLYRVVGAKTETFRSAAVGDRLQFGGKFKVSIMEGIHVDETLERVVGISTGVGIGPLIGFSEQALSSSSDSSGNSSTDSEEENNATDINNNNTNNRYRVDLHVAFRDPQDICCADTLDALQQAHPDRFSWTPVVSSIDGHVSSQQNLQRIVAQSNTGSKPGATHYHLIGNGSMVNEFKQGLIEAGVPEDRVTIEMYFNHKEIPRAEVVERIATTLKEQ